METHGRVHICDQMGSAVGRTGWIKSQRYAIQALFPETAVVAETPNPVSDATVQRMFQALLAERFGLVVRQETRDRGVYFIEVDESAAEMRERMARSFRRATEIQA